MKTVASLVESLCFMFVHCFSDMIVASEIVNSKSFDREYFALIYLCRCPVLLEANRTKSRIVNVTLTLTYKDQHVREAIDDKCSPCISP